MANKFGTDILIQSKSPMKAANFYVKELGFKITGKKPSMISLHGENINFFIERGPALGPVLEVTVKSVKEARARLKKKGLPSSEGRARFSKMLHKRSEWA